MKAPNGKPLGDGSAQAHRLGRHSVEVANSPKNFVVLRKICFIRMIKQKSFSLKFLSSPQTLKPCYGPGSATIVSAIRIFNFEGHLTSRCSITSETFFINHLYESSCKHVVGAELVCCGTGSNSKLLP